MVEGEPRVMNRAVKYELMNQENEDDYAMGPLEIRENVLIWCRETK